jgi:hypothetical protein
VSHVTRPVDSRLIFPVSDKSVYPCFLSFQPCHPGFQGTRIQDQLRANNSEPLLLTMAERLIPLAGEDSKAPPPTYEAAAIQHGALPARNGPPTPGAKPLPRGPFPLDIPVLNQLRGKRVILASASPSRRQILSTVQF